MAGLYSDHPCMIIRFGCSLRRHEWRKKQPVNLSLSNRLDFAEQPINGRIFKTLYSGDFMDFEVFRKNCCGLDVHKTWSCVCIGIPDINGRTEYKQARFYIFKNEVASLSS